MNRGETGQKICRSRLRAENCSTWNNFVSREQGGILKLFHVEQFDSPSGAFSAPNRHWRIPSGPSRDRSALGGEGIPKIVPRGTILSDPASIPEAYWIRRRISQGTFASARFQIVPRGTIWNRTALNSGCPQVVMASLRRLWRFGPEEDSRNCSTWNNLALRLRLTVASGKGPG